MTPLSLLNIPAVNPALVHSALHAGQLAQSTQPAKVTPECAAILTQMPVLAAGLASMLRSEGLQVSVYGEDPADLLTYFPLDTPALIILHGEAELSVRAAEILSTARPNSIVALWTEKITPQLAVRALEAGVRSILSTKLPAESTLSTLLEICRGEECQIRITTDTLARQSQTPRLNGREKQILRLVMDAAKNKEIGYELGLTESTVKVYLNRLFRKAGVVSRFELAQWAAKTLDAADGGEQWPGLSEHNDLALFGAQEEIL